MTERQMNRTARRAEQKKIRTALGKAKLRCIACDRTGATMNKEHYWPKWLIKYAKLGKSGVKWQGNYINAKSATIPLCTKCNSRLGSELESKVQDAIISIESGSGLSDLEAELLIKWLWKFEGMAWNIEHISHPTLRYSTRWTLIDRILGDSLKGSRKEFCLAIALAKKNDDGFDEYPVGIDSPITRYNSIFVSGVFSKLAIMSLSEGFRHLVPKAYDIITLKNERSDKREYFPRESFETTGQAIAVTKLSSIPLSEAHEAASKRTSEEEPRMPILQIPMHRVELP